MHELMPPPERIIGVKRFDFLSFHPYSASGSYIVICSLLIDILIVVHKLLLNVRRCVVSLLIEAKAVMWNRLTNNTTGGLIFYFIGQASQDAYYLSEAYT